MDFPPRGAMDTALPESPVSPPAGYGREEVVVDPSSAEFDWSTHQQLQQLQQQQQQYQQPIPSTSTTEEYYTPPSSSRPISAPPPATTTSRPVVVPTRGGSVREGKEKKSGWARLGLGARSGGEGEEEAKKGRKGKGKDVEKYVAGDQEKEPHSKDKESSFFGGLFGGRKKEAEAAQAREEPPVVEIRLPPPPPTASGALLPNGKYTNFYRLPIHVERAVYRLSHIKLANPRRPLYEQVLISNLMCVSLSSLARHIVLMEWGIQVLVPLNHQQARRSDSDSSPRPHPRHATSLFPHRRIPAALLLPLRLSIGIRPSS